MSTVAISGDRYRRAFLLNLASYAGTSLLRLGVGLALARLMAPDQLGLFAIALGLVGVLQIARDAGVSAYLQHAPVLSAEHFRACLGLSISTTAACVGVLLAGSGMAASHFGQPALQPLLQVLSLGLLFSPHDGLMSALALRDLDAKRISTVSRLGALANASASLGLCLLGCGVQGLAWASVANVVVCNAVYALNPPVAARGLPWRPVWTGWREPLRFGLGASTGTLLQTLNGTLPDLLLGRIASPLLVGLLGRASTAVGLFGSLLGPALGFGALPGLAQMHHRREALGPVLARATALLTGLAWPLLALSVWFGRDLLLLLYGPAWLACVPALLPLAVATALGLTFGNLGIALSAVGRPALAALLTGLMLAARLALLMLLFDGSLASCAWALAGAALCVLPVQLLFSAQCLGFSPLALWRAVRGSLALASCTLAAAALAPWAILPVWLAAIACGGHPLRDEALQLLRLRSTIRK